MTDRHTDQMAQSMADAPAHQAVEVVRAPVSRLVCDVERFRDDATEPMSERYYDPHHARLDEMAAAALERDGRCLVPGRYYRSDPRVASIMIEIRRDLYMDEGTGERTVGLRVLERLLSDLMRKLELESV